MTPYYTDAFITIYIGDCREVIPQLDEIFDACVTDPPYHLTQGSRKGSPRQNDPETPYGRTRLGSAGFMGKTWDGGDVAFQAETWEAVATVLKPGAHIMAFGGTRTNHRLACAIEDAGFEIRDMLMWLYGSGFPKSLDISKAIDKMFGAAREIIAVREDHNICRPSGGGEERLMTSAGNRETRKIETTAPASDAAKLWDGYGTALKPAWEPIILAMKPCDGTFAENALEHGVAGLNIDGSRIGTNPRIVTRGGLNSTINTFGKYAEQPTEEEYNGRWPANLILDEEAAVLLDEQTGMLTDCGGPKKTRHNSGMFGIGQPGAIYRDMGGASRFFYTAKADSTERGTGNNHPTVKPLDLMRYLCKLLAPPSGGLFFEPFAGSGTTLIACKALNIRAVGIELSEEYAEIAAKRLSQEVLEFISV